MSSPGVASAAAKSQLPESLANEVRQIFRRRGLKAHPIPAGRCSRVLSIVPQCLASVATVSHAILTRIPRPTVGAANRYTSTSVAHKLATIRRASRSPRNSNNARNNRILRTPAGSLASAKAGLQRTAPVLMSSNLHVFRSFLPPRTCSAFGSLVQSGCSGPPQAPTWGGR